MLSSNHLLQVLRIPWNAGRNLHPKTKQPVYQPLRMRLKIHRATQGQINCPPRLALGQAICSKTIVVQHPEGLQQQVEKVLPVHPLDALTDLRCLLCLMAARPRQTRLLAEFERNILAQPEKSEVRPTTPAYFAAHSAVINSRTNSTGCVTRSPFISSWRVGYARLLEALWYCHQRVAPIVPIATSWIQH